MYQPSRLFSSSNVPLQFTTSESLTIAPQLLGRGSWCSTNHRWQGLHCQVIGRWSSSKIPFLVCFLRLLPVSADSDWMGSLWNRCWVWNWHVRSWGGWRGCSQEQLPWVSEWSRIGQREKGCSFSERFTQSPGGALELKWAFKVVLPWSNGVRPLYSPPGDQSLDARCL